MKYRWFAYCIACTCAIASLGADTFETENDIEDEDIQALRDWINAKRQVTLKELGGDLSISGQVRTEFQANRERVNGKNQRGRGTDFPNNGYDIELNLMFDYRTDRTWAAVKIEFDNDMGIFKGSMDHLALERAYWGARMIDADEYSFDVEIGRNSMSSIYDSKIEFGSIFDGILLRYDRAFSAVGDFYIHPGALLVYDKTNQFAYVVELGLLNIKGTGIYTKLSAIDWYTRRYEDNFVNNRFRFLVTQLILGYRFKIECVERMGIFYMSALWNGLAKKLEVSNYQRANWGGYVGFSIGQLRKQWDWALDVNYQVVAAQAIPDFDASGIGLGNINKVGFYTKSIRGFDGGGVASTRNTAAGSTNFRGFAITFDLLFTDKLDWQQSYQQAITLNSSIGPFRRYHQYEMEFIYSW